MQWEQKIVAIEDAAKGEVSAKLMQYGKAGWEFTNFQAQPLNKLVFVGLKRPKRAMATKYMKAGSKRRAV